MSRVAWQKMTSEQITEMYTTPLNERMCGINGLLDGIEYGLENKVVTLECIDNIIELLVHEIHQVSKTLPQIKFNKHLKPYWTKHLNKLSKNTKIAWYQWMQRGKPRNNDPDYNAYITSKRDYHYEIKRAQAEYEIEQMNSIRTSQEVDHAYFWKLIKRNKQKPNSTYPIKLKNGIIITEPDDIVASWKTYYEQLYIPLNDDAFDDDFKTFVEGQLKKFNLDANVILDDILGKDITINELQNVIKGLKNNKAPGWDNLTAEHIKHGGSNLLNCLLRIFSLITSNEHIPTHFKIGLLVPIPKGTKDKSNQDNHRGLTLLSVIGKLYEKCVSKRFVKWLVDHNAISDIQGCGKDQCSSLHTAWVLKEIISENVTSGRNVMVGLLDAKKAFDTLWIDGLFYKLYMLGLRGKAWRVLRALYEGFICRIKLGGRISDSFKVLQGIHQGAPLSMDFYCVFNNDLLSIMQNLPLGVKVANLKVNCVAFADDVALIASCQSDLQMLFDIAHQYSLKWRFHYNPSKCVVLVFGNRLQPCIALGRDIVKVEKCEKHLGVALTSENGSVNKFIKNRISSCKTICHGIKGIGSKLVPVSPMTATKLYNTVCLTKLCYGMEIMNVDDETINMLESFHCTSSKAFQGLPIQCSNAGSTMSIGWLTIESIIDMSRLMFMWRILLLPMTCIYKVILIRRLFTMLETGTGTGPTYNMMETFKKYDLFNVLCEAVYYADYVPYNTFKHFVKQVVMDRDVKRSKITCMLYKSLSIFDFKSRNAHYPIGWAEFVHRHPIYNKEVRCIMNLLLNTFRIGKKLCILCNDYHVDNLEQILFNCQFGASIREPLWQRVIKACPIRLADELRDMCNAIKVDYILNALKCHYVNEWETLYIEMCQFVYKLYNSYYVATKAVRP